MGLSINDLENLDQGAIMDMIVESSNDNCEYDIVATQSDYDNF